MRLMVSAAGRSKVRASNTISRPIASSTSLSVTSTFPMPMVVDSDHHDMAHAGRGSERGISMAAEPAHHGNPLAAHAPYSKMNDPASAHSSKTPFDLFMSSATTTSHMAVESEYHAIPHGIPQAHASLNFSDSSSAHSSKNTFDILRAIAVFQACRIKPLIKHAEGLLNLSTKVFGSTITNTVVKHTFFNHFCAGEDSVGMKPVIDMLQHNNIGPILDYAAESEGSDEKSSCVEDILVEGECGSFVPMLISCHRNT